MMAGLVAAARCDWLAGLRRISIERRDRAVMRFPLIAKNQLAKFYGLRSDRQWRRYRMARRRVGPMLPIGMPVCRATSA